MSLVSTLYSTHTRYSYRSISRYTKCGFVCIALTIYWYKCHKQTIICDEIRWQRCAFHFPHLSSNVVNHQTSSIKLNAILHQNHLQHINGTRVIFCLHFICCLLLCNAIFYYYHEMNETNDGCRLNAESTQWMYNELNDESHQIVYSILWHFQFVPFNNLKHNFLIISLFAMRKIITLPFQMVSLFIFYLMLIAYAKKKENMRNMKMCKWGSTWNAVSSHLHRMS